MPHATRHTTHLFSCGAHTVCGCCCRGVNILRLRLIGTASGRQIPVAAGVVGTIDLIIDTCVVKGRHILAMMPHWRILIGHPILWLMHWPHGVTIMSHTKPIYKQAKLLMIPCIN